METSTAEARHGGGRALVAEDNPLNFEFVADVLQACGWDVEWARDGQQAMAALIAERFDLLLLDLHMPEVDGLQVLDRLSGSVGARIEHRPRVVVLTADLFLGLDADLLARGADAVLTKPVRLADFNAVLAATPTST